MTKNRKITEKGRIITVGRAIGFGILLLFFMLATAGHLEVRNMTGIATTTMDTLKRQCISFDKLTVLARTKSLFRMTDMLRSFSEQLAEDPKVIEDAYLEDYVDRMRISGIALMDEKLQLEASGYTREFRDAEWTRSESGSLFSDIVAHPSKIFAERVEVGGEYYDICAVARKDKKGIIIGFYKQPAGLIVGTENDLESLLSGLYLERKGHYAIVENQNVRATSDTQIQDRQVSDHSVLAALSHIAKDGHLHIVHANGRYYWGYRSGYDDYALYMYYPFYAMFSMWYMLALLLAALYSVLCFVYFAMRNRVLYENQQELQESNQKLTETVEMLRALETIYFSLFYVDLEKDQYKTIYLAPWLIEAIPQTGTYTQLKRLFVDTMVLPEYRSDVDYHMSHAYIQEALGQKDQSDVRKSFYVDYQAIRGEIIKWCRVSATVVDYDAQGNPIHVLALLQDVDKEKAKEADYQARILKEAQEAKIANNAKTEFLRRISHDIRTPINGIQGYIDMGASHPEDISMQTHCRENASASLHTLLEMVNSILEMSKLESEEISLDEKPFDLSQLLNETNVVLEPQAEAKQISYERLRTQPLAITHLIGSPRHVTQILLNVVSNAVKYGKTGGYVRLNTRIISSTDEQATYEFSCEDNGIGMSEEFQKHLFEPFVQEAQGARTTYEGTGLGLAIVKKLVDALGGTIICESTKDVGTLFRIQLTFRIDKEYHGDAHAVCEQVLPLAGVHVLLVEDNELNMEIAEFFLREYGADVTNAWNGKEAVDAFAASKEGCFDVIVTDVMMPVMDGLEEARTIRALERSDAKEIPMIAMSANAFPDDVQRSLDAGMSAHIAKPVNEKTLLYVIEEQLAATGKE